MTERERPSNDVDAHAATEAVSGDGTQTGPRSRRSAAAAGRIGRFVIEGPLGSGGMGDVFRAHDSVLDRSVALKLLRADDGCEDDAQRRRRVVREARAAAALTHPNTVTIFDVGEDGGNVFIAMELLEGEELRATLERGDATLAQKLRWLREAASALAAAHERGLVHRDVKPENMFVCKDGTLKLLDFGIAKKDEDEAATSSASSADPAPESLGPSSFKTAIGRRFGTPRYMAPEQHAGEPTDPRTDQYAWGLVAFELLTGSLSIDALPTRTNDGSVSAEEAIAPARYAELRARLPELPDAIARVVERALEPKKDSRYPSMTEVVDALDAADLPDSKTPRDETRGPPPPPPPPPTPEEVRTIGRSHKRSIVPLVVGCIAVVGLALGLRAWRHPPPPSCFVVSNRDLAFGDKDRAGFSDDGRILIARDVGKTMYLEHEGPDGKVVPSNVHRIFSVLQETVHDVAIEGSVLQDKAATMLLVRQDNANSPDGVFIVVWNEDAGLSMQRVMGGVTGYVAGRVNNRPFVVTTLTTTPPRGYDQPIAVEIYSLAKGTQRSEIELTPARYPTVAVVGDRIVVAYVTGDGIHVVTLDTQLQRTGDIMKLPYDIDAGGAPALAFDGKMIAVYWDEDTKGKKRIMSSVLAVGSPAFSKPTLAIDEPVMGYPVVVRLENDGRALAWVRAVNGVSTLRVARIASDGSLMAPTDVASQSYVREIWPMQIPRSPAALMWRPAPDRLRVTELSCPEPKP